MVLEIVLVSQLALQILTAALAFRLIRATGARAAWSLVAGAILLMVVRRAVLLFRVLDGSGSFTDDPFMEWLGLAISVSMFVGVAGIRPIFDAQRRVAEALRESEDQMRLFLGSMTDYAIFMLDPSGCVSSWNAGSEQIKGYRAEEILGRHFACFYPPEEIEAGRPQEALRTAAARGRFEEEGWRLRKDGSRIWANVVISAIRDSRGRLRGFSKVTRDMTERRRADLAIRLNEARLSALEQLSQMTDASQQEIVNFAMESAVALTGSQIGYVALANEDETVLTMYSWSKTAMRECAIIDKPIVYPVVDTGLWGEAVRQRKPVVTNDYQAPNPAKKGFPAGHVDLTRHMNVPVFDDQRIVVVAGVGNKEEPYDDSDVRQLTLLMRGMWRLWQRSQAAEQLRAMNDALESRVAERTAELGRANTQLLRAKEAAEEASRAKSTFLANMSHEIRTPLNAIIGMTELVLQSELSVQQREFLATVRDSGEALLSTIKDILDFSKIEAGKLVLEKNPFDLRESLGDTMKSFAVQAHQRGLELACLIHPDVPHFVNGDYNRLRQIVVNLVGNGLKFTERGEVTLEVSLEGREADVLTLHFVVADTGIGIPCDKQAAIFESFEQADPSTTRRHGGTGLGLAIAARLVHMMGGRIWVQSDPGCGSRFHFLVRLETAAAEAAAEAAPEPPSLHGLRVLVVDDNATNRRILEEVLGSWQMSSVAAPGAAEAIHQLREAKRSGAPFRLVLTDAHMPYVDGFTLARQIRNDPELNSTIVMMLTSGDRAEDIDRCRELGIVAYLLKPVKQSELLEAIELALGIGPVKARLARPQEWKWTRSLRILLAEDSLVNQKLAVAVLQRQGHSVKVAGNGREAVAYAAAEPFDLILMDVQMPELDGLDATVKIREWEGQTGRHVPIIAVTAHALKGDRERCLDAGVDGYLAKPLRADELFEAIARLLPEAVAPHAADPPAAPLPAAGDDLDWAEALEMVMGDRTLLDTVVEAALVEVPRLVSAMADALARNDNDAFHLAAHTLKGSLRYFGKTPALDHVARLEQLAKDHHLAESQAVFPNVQQEMAGVLRALENHGREKAGTP